MQSSSPIKWRTSFTTSETNVTASSIPMASSPGTGNINSNGSIQKRRKSSFSSLYSPYTRRRSFLSKNMIENESVQCYKLPNYSSIYNHSNRSFRNNSNDENIPSFSMCLSESQGFLWNQDLFASSYQQSEAGVNTTMSMSDGSYYINGNQQRRNISNIILGREGRSGQSDNNDSLVDVIDVVIDTDDYNSDVDIVTEVVKVHDQEEDEDDDDDDDEGEEGDETNRAIRNDGIRDDYDHDDIDSGGADDDDDDDDSNDSDDNSDDDVDDVDHINEQDYEADAQVGGTTNSNDGLVLTISRNGAAMTRQINCSMDCTNDADSLSGSDSDSDGIFISDL